MPYELDFLDVPRRPDKPRTRGITMVRDAGLGITEVREALAGYGEYMDYAKLRQFVLWYTQSNVVREKIAAYRDAGLKCIPGGTVYEAGHLRGMVPQTLEALRELGFEAIELSENVIELSVKEKIEAIQASVDEGFEVFFEYGPKYEEDPIDVEGASKEIGELLDAGAYKIILERSQLDVTIGPKGDFPTAGRLTELVDAVGLDNIVFEAETLDHQVWLINQYGSEVNLGPNIAPFHVVSQLEQARIGMGRAEGYTFFTTMGATLAKTRSSRE